MIDIYEKIIPNESIGGLKLRTKLKDIQNLIKGKFQLTKPFEARYLLGNDEIEVTVDVRNGKIYQLTANSGYKGKLFDKIEVGMKVSKAMEYEPNLFYDEVEEAIFCKGVNGLIINLYEIDPPPEIVKNLTISSISVYAEEIDTIMGQNGNW